MFETTTLPWVDEDALVDAHLHLHHYTQLDHLPKILSSGGLLARRYDQTNDALEFKALRETIVNVLVERAIPTLKAMFLRGELPFEGSTDTFVKLAVDQASDFFDALVKSIPSAPYMTCFSKHERDHHKQNGSLTMWRAYGRERAIALSFRSDKLVKLSHDLLRTYAFDTAYLEEVGYGTADPKIQARLDDFPTLDKFFIEAIYGFFFERREFSKEIQGDLFKFLVLIAACKHPDFEDEREVRFLVTRSLPQTRKKRRLPKKIDDRILIPCLSALDEILIGPHENQDDLNSEALSMLDAARRPDVKVRNSMTPFRMT